jgi:hypothetical protein
VPRNVAPPPDCAQFTEPDGCFAAGCSAFVDADQLIIEADTCFCNATSMCLWLTPGVVTSPDRVGYYNPGVDGVYVFEGSFEPPPSGWIACGADPTTEPAACSMCQDELQFCV